MGTRVGPNHGTWTLTGSFDLGGIPGGAALVCPLKEGHVVKSRNAGEGSREGSLCLQEGELVHRAPQSLF